MPLQLSDMATAAELDLHFSAPRNFIDSYHRDYSSPPPRDPLQHYEFRRIPFGDDTTMAAQREAELTAFEDEDAKLPLAVPAPPAGVSEFAMVRYLFCNICYVSTPQDSQHLAYQPQY